MEIKITNLKEYAYQVKRVGKLLGARVALKGVAVGLQSAWRAWFKTLDKEKSKYKHNFYTREGVRYTRIKSVDEKRAIVSNYSRPMAHKFFGGRVNAVNAEFLTIPLSDTAKRARSVRDSRLQLFPIRSKRGNLLLVESVQGGRGEIEPHYLLRKSVTHKPRKYVVPTNRMDGQMLVFKEVQKSLMNLIRLYENRMRSRL